MKRWKLTRYNTDIQLEFYIAQGDIWKMGNILMAIEQQEMGGAILEERKGNVPSFRTISIGARSLDDNILVSVDDSEGLFI